MTAVSTKTTTPSPGFVWVNFQPVLISVKFSQQKKVIFTLTFPEMVEHMIEMSCFFHNCPAQCVRQHHLVDLTIYSLSISLECQSSDEQQWRSNTWACPGTGSGNYSSGPG